MILTSAGSFNNACWGETASVALKAAPVWKQQLRICIKKGEKNEAIVSSACQNCQFLNIRMQLGSCKWLKCGWRQNNPRIHRADMNSKRSKLTSCTSVVGFLMCSWSLIILILKIIGTFSLIKKYNISCGYNCWLPIIKWQERSQRNHWLISLHHIQQTLTNKA